MATGKRPVSVSDSGDTRDTVRNLVNAMNSVRTELAMIPGVGELLAGEAIGAGKAIYISGSSVFLASAAASQPAIGVSISSAAAAGDKIRFILGMGYANRLTGLTPNSSVYLGNAGALVYAIPGAGMRQSIGWALSATELFVTISQPF